MQDNLLIVTLTLSGCPHLGHGTFKIYCLLAHMLSTRLGYLRPAFLALAFALAFCEEDSFLDLPSDLGLFLFHTFFCVAMIYHLCLQAQYPALNLSVLAEQLCLA